MMGHNSQAAGIHSVAEHQFFAQANAAAQKFNQSKATQVEAIVDLVRALWTFGLDAFGSVEAAFDQLQAEKIAFASDFGPTERAAIVWLAKGGTGDDIAETFPGADGEPVNALIELWQRKYPGRKTANTFRSALTSATKTAIRKELEAGTAPADIFAEHKETGWLSEALISDAVKKATDRLKPKSDEAYRDEILNRVKREEGTDAMISLIRTEGALDAAIAGARVDDEQKAEAARLAKAQAEAIKGMSAGQRRRYEAQQRQIAQAIAEEGDPDAFE